MEIGEEDDDGDAMGAKAAAGDVKSDEAVKAKAVIVERRMVQASAAAMLVKRVTARIIREVQQKNGARSALAVRCLLLPAPCTKSNESVESSRVEE